MAIRGSSLPWLCVRGSSLPWLRVRGRLRGACLAAALLALAGCYSIGFEPEAGIESIAVPLFRNVTLRREVEHALTRHVRREVLETTPLHLDRLGSARHVLRGTVVSLREGPLVIGSAQEVLESSVTVTVSFGVHEGPWDESERLVIGDDTDGDGAPDADFVVTGFAEFNAVRGESRETATDEALRDIAEQIVWRLQRRDDDRFEPNDAAEEAALLTSRENRALIQRNEDWYRIEVGAGQALQVMLLPARHLDLEAFDPAGFAVPCQWAGMHSSHVTHWEVGEVSPTPRTVLLHVMGPDDGSRYDLIFHCVSPPPR